MLSQPNRRPISTVINCMMRARSGLIPIVVAFAFLATATAFGQSKGDSTPPTGTTGPASDPASPRKWIPYAKADNKRLPETSGIVASRKYPGVLWTHGDSGNDPKLIAIDVHGNVLAEVYISGAPNTDWEDICADDQGNLYIGDIGNNHAMFPARYIYCITEPDPHNPPIEPIAPTKRWRFKYPNKERFDCEALFWADQSLYVIANLKPMEAIVYRLSEIRDGQMELVPVAEPHLPFPNGADVSPDGKQLVISSYGAINVFDIEVANDKGLVLTHGRSIRYPMKKGAIESVCFLDDDVVAMSERGKLYRLQPQDFESQVRFVSP